MLGNKLYNLFVSALFKYKFKKNQCFKIKPKVHSIKSQSHTFEDILPLHLNIKMT